jgi:hypothetical protein
LKAPIPTPTYGSTPPRPIGRKRTVAVTGTMRSFRSCSISMSFTFVTFR